MIGLEFPLRLLLICPADLYLNAVDAAIVGTEDRPVDKGIWFFRFLFKQGRRAEGKRVDWTGEQYACK